MFSNFLLLCYLGISEPIICPTSQSLGLQSRPADHDLFYGMDPTQNFRTKALAISCNIPVLTFTILIYIVTCLFSFSQAYFVSRPYTSWYWSVSVTVLWRPKLWWTPAWQVALQIFRTARCSHWMVDYMLTCQRDPKGQQFASSCDLIIKSDTLI